MVIFHEKMSRDTDFRTDSQTEYLLLFSSIISMMMRLLLDVSICFCPTPEPVLVVQSTSLLPYLLLYWTKQTEYRRNQIWHSDSCAVSLITKRRWITETEKTGQIKLELISWNLVSLLQFGDILLQAMTVSWHLTQFLLQLLDATAAHTQHSTHKIHAAHVAKAQKASNANKCVSAAFWTVRSLLPLGLAASVVLVEQVR